MAGNNIGVAVIGDVLDINTWSNIPWYFFTTGQKAGLFNQPWSLQMERFNLYRKIWNIKQLLMGKGTGGFQYTEFFLNRAESQIPATYFSSTVISFNQVFPRASTVVNAGGRIFYYIDTTLHDLFKEADYGISIPQAMKDKAIQQEKRNFAAAAGVVSMGKWTQESLIDFYGVPLFKIHQILPGANLQLPDGFQPTKFNPDAGRGRDFLLGFVGKDWKRKGLPLLIQVKNELRKRGYRVSIRAIGSAPEELIGESDVEFTGFINKQHDHHRFINALSSCDLGCLLSSTEALGISTLEFLRVGVPVLGFYHQGMKDTLLEESSIRIAPSSSHLGISDRIEFYLQHPPALRALKEASERASGSVTWERVIHDFQKLL